MNIATSNDFSGWRVCLSLAVVVSLGMALTNSFGVILVPIANDFDMDIATVGIGMSIFMLSVGLTAPIMGKLADTGPIKPVMLGGVVLMVAGIAIMTRVHSGGLLALGMLLTSVGIVIHGMVPSNSIATNWFIQRRASALAVIAVGLSIGGLWIPPATAWLMAHGTVENDWRYALQTLSYILGAIAFIVIAVGVVRTPEDIDQYPDGDPANAAAKDGAESEANDASFKTALASRDLWFMALAFGVITMVSLINGAYIVPFLESNGTPKLQAAYALSAIALASIVGSISAGAIADRIGPKIVLISSQCLIIAAFLVYLSHPGYIISVCAAAAVGLSVGAFMPMQPTSAGSRFGRGIAGRVIGIYGLMGLPFSLSGIPVAGLLSKAYGSYDIIYMVAIGLLLVALSLLSLTNFTQHAK